MGEEEEEEGDARAMGGGRKEAGVQTEENWEDREEDFFVTSEGVVDLVTRKKRPLGVLLPEMHSSFQTGGKLYVVGGLHNLSYLAEAFTVDLHGYRRPLPDMGGPRCKVSLCGVSGRVLAVGGELRGEALRVVECYCVATGKWVKAPGLQHARSAAGSVLLGSGRAFVFCGEGAASEGLLNSVEVLEQGGVRGGWRVLGEDLRVERTSNLAAVAWRGRVLVFGGSYKRQHMYCFDEEGRLVRALSHVQRVPGGQRIPGGMSQGAVVVRMGKVFAYGWRHHWWNPRWAVSVFSGNKWSSF